MPAGGHGGLGQAVTIRKGHAQNCATAHHPRATAPISRNISPGAAASLFCPPPAEPQAMTTRTQPIAVAYNPRPKSFRRLKREQRPLSSCVFTSEREPRAPRRVFDQLRHLNARLPRAQQPAMPVIGLLGAQRFRDTRHSCRLFRRGLNEAGSVEGRDATIEYRWADNHYDRLPALAADLVRRQELALSPTMPGVPRGSR